MARPSTLDTHPQRKQIIKALIDGEPVRKIAAWTNPPVSYLVIQRYKTVSVKPAIERSGKRVRNLDRVKNQHVTPDSETAKQIATQAVQDAPVLALRDARLKLLQGLVDRLNIVMSERAEHYADAPGGKSGLLAKDIRGTGENAKEVYKVDGVVLSEARELSKQIAQELGQWTEKVDVSGRVEVDSRTIVLSQVLTLEEQETFHARLVAAAQKQLPAGEVVDVQPSHSEPDPDPAAPVDGTPAA